MPENLFQVLLNAPVLSRIRRNHGLEHATLHILSRRFPRLPMAGHSTAAGFRLVGVVQTEAVGEAVEEALTRLRLGEHSLAVHPNCGTNFVTAGIFSGLAGAVSMLGAGQRRRDKVERLPLAAALATLALVVSLPLGLLLQQRVTTSGEPGGLEIESITRSRHAGLTIHTVLTRG
jgi:hypothetical protein